MPLNPKQYRAVEQVEILDANMVAILSAKSPGDRLAVSHAMWRSARDMIRNLLKSEHPDWSTDQIQKETARRLLNGAL